MSVEIITESFSWNAALSSVRRYDFTHTFEFHKISERRGEGTPKSFVFRDADGRVLAFWPVLQRMVGDSEAYDFTSVYGYCGPLVAPDVDSTYALEQIVQAMTDDRAVALFSRMHPLLNQGLEDSFRGQRLGDVVVIDVGCEADVLRSYRGSHRREIVRAEQMGVLTTVETGPDAVGDFHRIYSEAMNDLAAKQYYFFDIEYLRSMATAADFRTFVFYATLGNVRIAAAMFIVTGSVMQYYLSGTVAEFRRLAPSKVIVAHAHKLAVGLGLQYLILGGGVGSGEDPLFAFKKGFSSISLPFYITRRILDHEKYAALCLAHGVRPERSDYFPAYRADVPEG